MVIIMKISKERFDELGLGCDRLNCMFAEDCTPCGQYEIADCVDDERLRMEMTEEEYDAYRHGRLHI